MLIKLMKYEWKATWKACAIINFFTVFATILGVFAMRSLQNGILHKDQFTYIAVILFVFYYLSIIGVSFSMSIYIGVRFYCNLYTDEGYLMHTLPVTKRQLVLSKLLIHTVCTMITQVLLVLSICVMMFPLLALLLDEPALSVPMTMLAKSIQEATGAMGISLPAFFLCSMIAAVIGQTSGILSIYCAISLGQTFHRHKVMGSILCYIGIYCLIQTATTILTMPQMYAHTSQMESLSVINTHASAYLYSMLLSISVESLFIGIACYILTLHLMNKKLNLQ